jgi:hypothetical protein
MDATDAVLLYDGYLTLGGQKTDAVFVEVRAYFSPRSKATLAVPYVPKASGTFQVRRPTMLEWQECEDFDGSAAVEAFFAGAESHEQAWKVWTAHFVGSS